MTGLYFPVQLICHISSISGLTTFFTGGWLLHLSPLDLPESFPVARPAMAEPPTELGDRETKLEVDPSDNVNNGNQPAPEISVKETATTPGPAENAPKVTAACKKHPDTKHDSQKKKKKKKSKKKHEAAESPSSDSDSSSSSSSSSSSESAEASNSEDAESDSDASESAPDHRRRQRIRAKARARRAQRDKKKKKKTKTKTKSRKQAQSDSESESSSDADSESEDSNDGGDSVDEKAIRKLVAQLKLSQKRVKRLRGQVNDPLGGLDPPGESRRDKRSRKRKPASKVAFKRVDQRECQILLRR